jgi:glycosyltransferase involved in cell wall biosynthesis
MEIIHVVLGKANPERMNGAFDTNLFKFGAHMLTLDHWLKEFILSKKNDAVFHIHGGFILKWFALAWWMSKNNVKYVFTPHGSYNVVAMERSSLRKKVYIALFERFVLRKASSIHCLGLSEVHGLRSIYNGDNVQLIHTGIDLNPQDNGTKPADFVVSYCGRLDIHTKGLDLLVEGFAKFQSEINEAKLSIVGDGPGMETMKQWKEEYELGDAMVLHGACFGVQKDKLISDAHLFAHPSRNEGLPTAVLESAAMAMPCLISEATNVAQYVLKYKAGFVMSEMSSEAIYNCLVEAYKKHRHHDLDHMGRNAYTMVQTEFNWKKVVHDFGKLYLAA